MELNINVTAILVAALANFFAGFVWYTLLFGKIWGKEMGFDPKDKPATAVFVKGLVFMLVGNFLMAWVLAHNNAAWQFVPGIKELGMTGSAINAAVFTWLGFYFPGELGATVWEKKSWKLFFINSGYHLLSLAIVSFILTFWTKH